MRDVEFVDILCMPQLLFRTNAPLALELYRSQVLPHAQTRRTEASAVDPPPTCSVAFLVLVIRFAFAHRSRDCLI